MINAHLAFEYTAACLAGKGRSSKDALGPAVGLVLSLSASCLLWAVLVRGATWAAHAMF